MGVLSDAAVSKGAFRRELDDARTEIAAARTAKRARATTVSKDGMLFEDGGKATFKGGGGIEVNDGGEITINGGSLRLTSADGTTGLFYAGPGGGGLRLWQGSFPNGEPAFGLLNGTDPGYWGGNDNTGNLLIANDAVSGQGFSRPWFSYALVAGEDAQQSGTSMWPSTTATAAGTTVMGVVVPAQHPRLHFGATVAPDAGTGHWALVIQTAAGATTVIDDETGFTVHTVDIPGWGTTVGFGQEISILLQAWVTGGGTRAWVQYDRCYGVGS